MKIIAAIFVIVSSLFTGCQSNVIYVVNRPVPNNPKFVVIPSSNTLSEIEYANKLEQLLIRYNILISSRPTAKYVEITEADLKSAMESQTKITGVGAQLLGGSKGSKTAKIDSEVLQRFKRESYLSFSDIDADYIIRTSRNSRELKLYKRQNQELLGFLWQVNPTYRTFGNFLFAAGIYRQKIEKQKDVPELTKIDYMSRDDVRERPIFTFIPANNYSKEVSFSNYSERLFFEFGVKIVHRPGLKKVEKSNVDLTNITKQKQGITTEVGQVQSGQNIKEFYYEYEKTDADYFVTTYSKSGQVRLVRKNDNSVVSIFNLKNWGPGLLAQLQKQSDTDLKIVKMNLEKLKAVGSKIKKVKTPGTY